MKENNEISMKYEIKIHDEMDLQNNANESNHVQGNRKIYFSKFKSKGRIE